jgi:hypothetical protein
MATNVSGASRNPCYFLVSVSTRLNLDLCIKHALAGFPSSAGGSWTYCEIHEGDYISFLYGAKAFNLYMVTNREAIRESKDLPPWPPLTFKKSGRKHSFPFRLHLKLVREFNELLVRTEFSYVAENLLFRGGYGKTHFQADQTTLQSVSGMGEPSAKAPAPLPLPQYTVFTPRFTRRKDLLDAPEVSQFREVILQSAIRRHLMQGENLHNLLTQLGLTQYREHALEILGEKALPQGHIDLLVKDRIPIGSNFKLPIEVKMDKGQPKDVFQLHGYMDEMLGESPVGILVAADFGRRTASTATANNVRLVRYKLTANLKMKPTFEEIYAGLTLEPVSG